MTLPVFGLPNAQECDHVSSPFWFDKQSHLTRIINLWHQNQLSHVSLNSWSTCFGRKFIACHSNPSFFFKFVANKYVINWRVFPTKTHPKGFVSFQTKFLFPYGIICHLEQRQSRNNNNSYKKKESFLSSNSQRSGN